MKRSWPFILIAVGLFLPIGGFIYDMIFAGIPYQDPTSEMSARYAYHSRVASTACLVGAGLFLVGSVAGAVRMIAKRFRSPDIAK
jgi:hypothetical protein